MRQLLAGVVLLASCAGEAQAPPPAAQAASAPTFDGAKAFAHIKAMVAFGPRPAGSPALKLTRDYIKKEMAAIGVPVEEQAFTLPTPVGDVAMVNLIARLPGTRPDKLLITGHYDTKPIKTSVFVGASDGASSGSILIELARSLKSQPRTLTYEFVWFDAEEAFCFDWDECGKPGKPDNTYGSRYYLEAAQKAGTAKNIKGLILFDMIGAADLKIRQDTGMSTQWMSDIFWAAARRMGHGGAFIPDPGPVGGDDHEAFVKAGIPSVDIIDLADYPQWHNSVCCDDLAHVSQRSMQIVGDVSLAAIPEIERRLVSGRLP